MRQIPNAFRCANRLWRVVYVDRVDDEGSDGETVFNTSEIRILDALSWEQKHHTFLHEVVHVIANAMGWEKLDTSEARVDAIAGLLCQILDSAVYPVGKANE